MIDVLQHRLQFVLLGLWVKPFLGLYECKMKDDEHEALLKRRQKAIDALPDLSKLLRGSLVRRFVRCGKPGCRCKKGRGHGPFVYLTVTLGVGRTKQITIAPKDYETAEQFVENYARLKELIEEVSGVNRELLRARALPRSPPRKAASPKRRRGSATP